MQVKPTLAALAAVLAFGALTPSHAQGLTYGIKFGGGLALNDIEAQSSRAALGFALTGGWNFRDKDELFAEFGYRYFKADWTERTLLPNTPSGYGAHQFKSGVGYALDADGNVIQGHIFNMDPNSGGAARGAVDMRKDNVESWGFNFGYRYNFPNTNFYVHGALMLNFVVYQQEIIGDLRVYNKLPDTPGTSPIVVPVQIGREGLNYTPGENSISPGFYVGGQWRMDKNFFAELNLGWMTYSTVNYDPFTYTGKTATTSTDKDSKITLEFSFGLRF